MVLEIEGPQTLPDWKARLEWMLEYQPRQAWAMFEKDPKRLMDSLNRATARSVLLREELKSQGKPRDVVDEIALSALAPSETDPPEPLPPEKEEKIRAWVRRLPEDKMWTVRLPGKEPT